MLVIKSDFIFIWYLPTNHISNIDICQFWYLDLKILIKKFNFLTCAAAAFAAWACFSCSFSSLIAWISFFSFIRLQGETFRWEFGNTLKKIQARVWPGMKNSRERETLAWGVVLNYRLAGSGQQQIGRAGLAQLRNNDCVQPSLPALPACLPCLPGCSSKLAGH